MSTLTIIIPTLNEELLLEGALHSALFADEIIVIDSFSEDRTPEIAKKYATLFLQREFDTFSSQKNFALKYATSDWVLFLDADERITHSLELEIKETIASTPHNGFKINFPHFFMNRFLYHESDKVIRLVKRSSSSFTGDVHEKLEVSGTVGLLKNDMIHYTYRGLQNFIEKRESYAWFQAGELMKKGEKPTLLKMMYRPAFRFFKSYILKRGFRDGIPGLAIASITAYGVFERYAKLILLRQGMR